MTVLDGASTFIAADVGGTHTRVALARARQAGAGDAPVELLCSERYLGAQWPGLAAIVVDFVARLPDRGFAGRPTAGVLACAGYVQDDRIVNRNLPWPVPLGETRARLGLSRLHVINDFEALAHAVPYLGAAGMRTLLDGGGREGGLAAGPMVVVGPGTGLGCAAVLPGAAGPIVLATEAGHIALAPGTPREADLLRVLARPDPHVPVEHALSGPGLLNLYRAVCELRGEPVAMDTPAAVSAAALGDNSAAAREALETFCALLGSFTADLAVLYRAEGGILLAGGILPQIERFLHTSAFRTRFLRKGVMVPFLERVPVRVVDHGDLGQLGAACWMVLRDADARRAEPSSA